MAFKARTLNAKPNEPNAYAHRGMAKTVDGREITGSLKAYPGKPTKAMLADDLVDVQSVAGDPWPNSASDRNSKKPYHMRIKQDEGRWPTERDVALEEFAEQQLEDPEHVARHMLKEQGESPAAIEKRIGRMKWKGSDIPTIPPKKRGPGRPKKSETEEA